MDSTRHTGWELQPINASQTELQLNLLAQKGAAFFRRAAVDCNRQKALNNACRALWVSPLVGLLQVYLAAPSVTTAITMLACSIIVVPVLVYSLTLRVVSATTQTSRKESLALYDKQLGLNDDLQIADEFRQLSAPTDFELAALASCSASVPRALAYELVPFPVAPPSLTTKQLIINGLAILTAVLLLIGAVLNTEAVFGASDQQVPQDNLLQDVATTDMADSTTTAQMFANSRPENAGGRPNQQAPATATPGQTTTATKSEGAAETGATSNTAGAATEGAKSTKAFNNATQPDTDKQPPPPGSATRSANAKTDTGSPSASAQVGPQQENQQADTVQASDNTQASTDNHSAQRDEQQRPVGQPPALPSGPQQAQRNAKKPNNSKKAGQQQSSGSQQNNSSQNNNSQGDEARKTSRGINQLMLAVPMEDQFIGTPGPGRDKSSPEQQPSEEQTAITEQSALRGQTMQSAPVNQKPPTQFWEKQLLSNFFRQQHQISPHNENANDN
ncbi:hypothetical protein [Alteromonas gilva]|uniref:DUF2868 domain-containing protein n=1 Tax=Alteromonas gilva TaxID=2987522 RepID=A0ABT5L376_9ALTE|nr:hypothetical protein [Alteromonas gilva]MDC8830228.1 hypothetical protein [Alteromonas gilva]